MNRDLANNLGLAKMVTPEVITADKVGAIIDLQGFDSAAIEAFFGVSGDTLSGSVYLTALLEHGDDSGLSDAAAVGVNDVVGGALDPMVDSGGVFVLVDDPAEDDTIHKISYVGAKRYLRLTFDITGTHSNGIPVSATCIRGNADSRPVA